MNKTSLCFPAKIILFLCFSFLYIFPLLAATATDNIVASVCISRGLGYEHGDGGIISFISSVAVMILVIILLIAIETVIYRKTDIHDGFFISIPFLVALIFVISANIIRLFFDRFFDGEMFLSYCAFLGIIKATYDIIRLIRIKRYKLITFCLICVLGTVICLFSPYLYDEYREYVNSMHYSHMD